MDVGGLGPFVASHPSVSWASHPRNVTSQHFNTVKRKTSFRAERSEVAESITDGNRMEQKSPSLHRPIPLLRRGARRAGRFADSAMKARLVFSTESPPRQATPATPPGEGNGCQSAKFLPSVLPTAARCWILRLRFATRWMTSEGAACALYCLASVRFLGVATRAM